MSVVAHSSQTPGWRARALVAAACSALFLAVYTVTQTLASARSVPPPIIAADWEYAIPVVPWTIVPYVSIDALFVLAPFVVSTARELRCFALRVVTAIGIAAAWFTCWPLQLGFARAPVDGVFGPWFDALHAFDGPHNLFPSLHIAFAVILRWTYHRHLRGSARGLMHLWLATVSISTLTTHQHHAIDVAGGAVLGIAVVYLHPTGALARPMQRAGRAPHRGLAALYATAAGAALLVATRGLSTAGTIACLWMGLALALVGAGYAGAGPRVFRKSRGYLSYPARFLLAPYLIGLHCTRRWYRRRDAQAFASIGDGVHFGQLPDAHLTARLEALGVRGLVDLTAEHSAPRAVRHWCYANPQLLDLAPPTEAELDTVVAAIESMRRRGEVYVCCALGFGRARAAVAHWLWRTGRAADRQAARARVAAARPLPEARRIAA